MERTGKKQFQSVDPVISVVIPNYNGTAYIPDCLDALRKQTLNPGFFEIIVVDNDSTDTSLQLLKSYVNKMPNLRLGIEKDFQSSYAARNRGISLARGELFTFTDIDCRPREDWLEKALLYFDHQNNHKIVSGSVKLFYRDSGPNVYELIDKYGSLRQEIYADSRYGATANLLVPRKIMEALGGFDVVVSGGDQVFCRKSAAAGFEFEFAKDLVVYHPARDSWHEVMKKARRVGRGMSQSIPLIYPKSFTQWKFTLRQFAGILIPRHQIKLFFKITRREKIDLAKGLLLLVSLLAKGFTQRTSYLLASLRLGE
jgi:glycosyltransferase involved in cell wall biosynthesis